MSNQPSAPTTTPDTPSNPNNQSAPQDEAPSNANTTISTSEINYILASCTANFRLDGRSNLDHRPYTLSSSSSSSTTTTKNLLLSNGSSRISLPGSTTDILCSIKAELIHPSPLHPNDGIVDLNLDLLPYATVTSTNDRKTIRNLEMEVASVLNHLLLPHVVHRPSLVVTKGRYVWRLNVDVLVLQCDGNLLDNCSLAIRGAVEDLRLPRVVPVALEEEDRLRQRQQSQGAGGGGGGKNNVSNELMLDSDVAHSVRPQGVENCPIVVTVLLLPKFVGDDMGRHCLATLPQRSNDTTTAGGSSAIQKVKKRTDSIMIVDASRQEEACASTKVSVSVDPSGRICGVHKYGSSSSTAALTGGGGGGTMPFELLTKVGNIAIATSKRITQSFQGGEAQDGGKSCGYDASQQYGNLLRGNFELR